MNPTALQFFGDYDRGVYDCGGGDGGVNEDEDGLPSDIQCRHLKTTARCPLVVRYRLPDATIIINTKLMSAPSEITCVHE